MSYVVQVSYGEHHDEWSDVFESHDDAVKYGKFMNSLLNVTKVRIWDNNDGGVRGGEMTVESAILQ